MLKPEPTDRFQTAQDMPATIASAPAVVAVYLSVSMALTGDDGNGRYDSYDGEICAVAIAAALHDLVSDRIPLKVPLLQVQYKRLAPTPQSFSTTAESKQSREFKEKQRDGVSKSGSSESVRNTT